MLNGNLKLAVQKKGRLTEKSLQLLRNCGLDIEDYSERLIISASNFKLDILYLRDDDIPEYVQDGVADAGIVGENIILEKESNVEVIQKLGFGKCCLSFGIQEGRTLSSLQELNNQKIATSFPNILKKYLAQNNINASVIEISGSVEIAPSLGVADVICDLVSTGNTLKMNKLKKSFDVFESEAVLIKNPFLAEDAEKEVLLKELLVRIKSAVQAKTLKYIMMNAPCSSLEKIKNIIPSLKSPTVLPLAEESMIAIHAVIPQDTFWHIYSRLTTAGASGILLLPIENLIL